MPLEAPRCRASPALRSARSGRASANSVVSGPVLSFVADHRSGVHLADFGYSLRLYEPWRRIRLQSLRLDIDLLSHIRSVRLGWRGNRFCDRSKRAVEAVVVPGSAAIWLPTARLLRGHPGGQCGLVRTFCRLGKAR